MNRPIRLLPAFLSVGAWTMLSRVLGLARDILMAAFLGTGPVAQAFLIAFTLPNMFRRFFAEGAFNLAFVPMFAKKVEAGEDAEGFARDALSGLGFVLIALHHRRPDRHALAGARAWPSGFAGDERFTLSVEHGRIAFPYIILISLTALLSGVLNSLGRFALPAAAPILMNVVMIAFLVCRLADRRQHRPLADLVGAGRRRRPARARLVGLRPRRHAGPAALAAAHPGDAAARPSIMVPALLAGGVVQINLHRRPPGRLLLRRRRRLALLRRPALPAAARRRRHRHRRRAAPRPLAPAARPATARAAATRSTAPPSSPSP